MNKTIYLDYAASTPVHESVAERMMKCLSIDGVFANPASRTHRFGWEAEELVDSARQQIAQLIGADAREIIFTSGATESDNLALLGAAQQHQKKGKHIVTLCTEHNAVLDSCRELVHQGFEVTYLPVQANGLIDLQQLEDALRDDTILVSVMHVNNEIGIIQPIQVIGQLCAEKDILFHVDAAQSAGKIPIDVNALQVDLMSLSGHKMYGPKGVGALYVRRRPKVSIHPQMHGGGHERGMRSGTLATHQIVGFGAAAALALQDAEQEMIRLVGLRDKLWTGIEALGDIYFNSDQQLGIGSTLSLCVGGVLGDNLLMSLPEIAVSSGSACNSATIEPSHVITALGRPRELALATMRISFGRYTTEADIDTAIQVLHTKIPELRSAQPLW